MHRAFRRGVHEVSFGPAFYNSSSPRLSEFKQLCSRTTVPSNYPLATAIDKNVPIYAGKKILALLSNSSENKKKTGYNEEQEFNIRQEWASCLRDGPGVFAITGAFEDTSIVDKVTQCYVDLLKAQGSRGDHFGKNERLWNSLQKLCLKDPQLFAEYFGHPLLALASRAWLGPMYQITAQVNNILPGGKPQDPHRDYHMGFQQDDIINYFPTHMQIASQFLTLQGLIAHTDMPRASGPTRLLPFSQLYGPGYMAYRLPEFREYFNQTYIDLPLAKGDMVFFNPALFHAGGENLTQNARFGNLVQISAAMSRAMESVDRQAMLLALYPVLLNNYDITDPKTHDIIAACAEGYSFPTNLDLDPPLGYFAPETPAQLCHRALRDKLTDRKSVV